MRTLVTCPCFLKNKTGYSPGSGDAAAPASCRGCCGSVGVACSRAGLRQDTGRIGRYLTL
jgi:hypothetical protein